VSEDWSRAEVEATVADYLTMLERELTGLPVNKAEHNRQLVVLLNNRSRAAVEFKHANISAALIDLGYPYIEGYKPRSNYQELLLEVLTEQVATNVALQAATLLVVEEPAQAVSGSHDYASILVAPPARDIERKTWKERRQPIRRPRSGINYLEREARNASLGHAGELFIAKAEHTRLWNAGHKRLADRIEHVSRTRGDGLGYDVLSFEPNGRERLLEVKTTRFGAMTPFFVSRNEVEVSQEEASNYHLCRVFNFHSSRIKVFTLSGPLRLSCLLEAVQFEASLP
jgi:hypothetical protein